MANNLSELNNFRYFDVMFNDEQGILQKIICSVKSIEIDTIELLLNNAKNNGITPPFGAEVKLYMCNDSGIYTAKANVIDVLAGVVSTEIIITHPTERKHSQRREFYRANLPVNYTVTVYKDNGFTQKIVFKGRVKNICGKGMAFIADKPILNFSAIEVELYFPERIIKTSAIPVYCHKKELNGKTVYAHALAFGNILQKNVDFLVKKCFLHQLNLKQRQI